ncbi:hypothetical protein [Pedobacter miscanthi]|uniref:hypothetical protein n=1 Tax=Pedobacter miscanthi TaxID=2259170 RepID=UPI00292F744F|nr:hypothetical protein [Pedobacter miscanthi]
MISSKRNWLVVLLVLAVFYGFFFIVFIRGKRKEKASAFSGIVQSVKYDAKGIPTVEIDNRKIYVSASFNWNNQIQAGDYIEKKAGENVYKVIKQDNKQILIFK